ncbi:hypothetical protein TSOC_010864 [Tetrabaena socialis]|uniref:Uncharacterized protein n=1 Tax=Tetrabaena socialis TaxID=47790 RepID=A0A2J7ZS53_9CHLO|nr:hypothetical protein TSOC_010864 [Tetrabaena socialis]|eukprot:PNH03102.1 hypothetical protein TSOC_010864 [Tetrabaena socialis]
MSPASSPSGATYPYPAQNSPWPSSRNPFNYTSPTSSSSGSCGALVLYNQFPSLDQAYDPRTDPHVHGAFATGLRANPFTPGLHPISLVPKPQYDVGDTVSEHFPAARASNDPLNWISEALFGISEARAKLSQRRIPIASAPC